MKLKITSIDSSNKGKEKTETRDMIDFSKIDDKLIKMQLSKDLVSSAFINYHLDFLKNHIIFSVVSDLEYDIEQ